ncbi:hypothetical protein E2C01_014783 [Portunus trituberculatus]|uniref:Uncharacterized protein n=1 Tax=Portunus trituberculatus TaxID=210409 RepID=A0A5B7DL08_PORTR|nr:hypothetical protein [Portunus trituberculatus]
MKIVNKCEGCGQCSQRDCSVRHVKVSAGETSQTLTSIPPSPQKLLPLSPGFDSVVGSLELVISRCRCKVWIVATEEPWGQLFILSLMSVRAVNSCSNSTEMVSYLEHV